MDEVKFHLISMCVYAFGHLQAETLVKVIGRGQSCKLDFHTHDIPSHIGNPASVLALHIPHDNVRDNMGLIMLKSF